MTTRSRPVRVVVTCEHGGNRVPARYAHWFAGRVRMLETHRAYDAGALAIARFVARAFAAPLVASTTSRLVVDLNRSLGNRSLWSDAMRRAPASVRREIVERHYAPYRNRVHRMIDDTIAINARVLHLSMHTFAPVLRGDRRRAHVGLLYDPSRRFEAQVVVSWQRALRTHGWVVRRNHPYAGTSDGFTTALRRELADVRYAGVEVEVNQQVAVRDGPARAAALRRDLVASLRVALELLASGETPAAGRASPARSRAAAR